MNPSVYRRQRQLQADARRVCLVLDAMTSSIHWGEWVDTLRPWAEFRSETRDLWSRYRDGDRAAFDALLDYYGADLLLIAHAHDPRHLHIRTLSRSLLDGGTSDA
jgi:hypothetical protein